MSIYFIENVEVFKAIESVLEEIKKHFEPPRPTATPPKTGGE